MAAFFNDTFTVGADTLLDAHTPDTGTGWTKVWGTDAGAALEVKASIDQVSADTDIGGANKGAFYAADATYPSANYYAQVTMVQGASQTTRPIFLFVRMTDANNLYAVRIAGTGGNNSRLYKKVSGTWTALGSLFATPANGSVIKLEINGTTLTCYDDGVSVQSVTDSSISATGEAGLGMGGGAEGTNSSDDFNTAMIVDNFSVEEVAAAGVSVTVNGSVQTLTASQPVATVTVVRNATINAGVQTITASQPSASVVISNASPTIALNTPDATETTDTTPVIEFTGTDAESNDIRYNIQIDTSSSFSSGGTIDSFSEANLDNDFSLGAGKNNKELSQAITIGTSYNLASAKFYLKKFGSPTGNIVAKLYAVTGTVGTNAVPTGSALVTSDPIDISTLSTSYALSTFTFSGYDLTSGDYAITIEYNGGDATNYLLVGTKSFGTGSEHAGNMGARNTSTSNWSNVSGADLIFYVTASASTDKVSGTDEGFANTVNGGDTDPFTSGQKISYTPESALATTTYYYRVRGIDPSGSNTYGAWSETRSIIISAGTAVTVNGSVQTATLTQPSATVTAVRNVTFSAGVQTLTSSQPTASVTAVRYATVTANVQTLTASQPTASVNVTKSVTISATVQSLTSTQPSAIVTAVRNATVDANPQIITASQPSAIVSTTRSVIINASPQALIISQPSPTVIMTRSVMINANTQTLTSSQPNATVTANRSVTVSGSLQVVTSSLPTPTITGVRNVIVNAATQTLLFSQPTATIGASATVTGGTQVATFTQPAPTVSAVRNVTVPQQVQTASFSQPSPTITTIRNVTANANVQTLTFTQPTPSVGTNKNATFNANVQSVTASQPFPMVTVGDGVLAAPQTATFSQPMAIVIARRNVVINATVQPLSVSQPVPSVTTQKGVTVNVGVQVLTATLPTPTITAGRSVIVSVSVVTATLSLPTPSVLQLIPGLYTRGGNLFDKAGDLYNTRGGDLYNNAGPLQTQGGNLYDTK